MSADPRRATAAPDARDRLQPALLDRLTDAAPASAVEAEDSRVMNKTQIRAAVLRDLAWLLNAVKPISGLAATNPDAAGTVLDYGMPAMAGQRASDIDFRTLEDAIREAIRQFEPRVMQDGLEVKAVESASMLDSHNVIEFEIRGFLWAQPVPLEMLLRTRVDLEAGQVEVRDVASATAPRLRT